MKQPRRAARSAPSGARPFDERLSVPWWWWLPAVGLVCLVVYEVHLGHPEVPTWLSVAVLAPLVALGLYRLGATRITLLDDGGKRSLQAGSARLPVEYIGAVEQIAARDKQLALGPNFDPAAYLVHRPWVAPMLRITVADPADPTPYWLFSVRRPERLRELLEQANSGPRE